MARLPQEMRESGLTDMTSELFALDEHSGWRQYFLWTMAYVMPHALAKRLTAGLGNGDTEEADGWK